MCFGQISVPTHRRPPLLSAPHSFRNRRPGPEPLKTAQTGKRLSQPLFRFAFCRFFQKEFDVKTPINIAAGTAVLGLLVACSNANNDNPRDVANAAGEPVGEVGVLTDVPTGQGASPRSDVVNGAVATEAPGASSSANPDARRTTPSLSATNPSPPASTSSPDPSRRN